MQFGESKTILQDMKIYYALITLLLISFSNEAIAQDKAVRTNDFAPIEQELKNWDPVRGPWLSSSLQSMSNNQPIPDRNFPERFTPHQMLGMVPYNTRSNMLKIAKTARNNGGNAEFWSDMTRYISAPNCQSTSGRTYGDPHLVSYDGARNSFQTVGEFVLTKSNNGEMEVQARQRPVGDDFSLNTAVAMNVAGDRVCVYGRDYPDGDYSTPVRLDGRPLHLNASTYFLEHGGTIKKSGKNYIVYWPTGESVNVEMRSSRNSEFMNVTVNVHDCAEGNYGGLLGNANGNSRDDFNGPGLSPARASGGWGDTDYLNRERQAYMAKDFAELHRVQHQTTLFDYTLGRNTNSYTDRSYPRVYRDFNDLNSRRVDRSRRHCQQQGVNSRDMQGCIYDNAYLGIDPSPAPVIPDPTKGTVLRPTTGRIENVNPPKPSPRPTPGRVDDVRGTGGTADRTIKDKPSSTRPTTTKPSTPRPRTNPTPTPRPTPPPRTQPKPRPAPTPRPKPTPKPTPAPTPRPSGGRGR